MSRRASPLPEKMLTRQQNLALTVLMLLASWPHFFNLNLLTSVFFICILSIRLFSLYRLDKPLARWLIFIIMSIGLGQVVWQYSGSIGKDFGVSLLLSMLAMKSLETIIRRDAYIILFLICFLMVTQFLYNQSLLLAIYLFALIPVVLFILGWINLEQPKTVSRLQIKQALVVSAQSLPVMIALFIFFPRLDGPLWGFEQGAGKAITGISDSIRPGSISQLSLSSATAFRVKFADDKIPEHSLLYWRGPVLSNTDGINWTADKQQKSTDVHLLPSGSAITYQLIQEANQQHWLFPLEMPASLPSGTYITREYSVRSSNKITQRTSYQMTSYTSYRTQDISPEEKHKNLQLPDNITAEMRQLSHALQSASKRSYADAMLDYFNKNEFVYTLRPPALPENPVQQFLFETRKGFCEHYATSFVVMMRLGNIPARVVAGYQGGEWNPAGKHLIVKQSDAHAWAEIWLDDQGWVRVDPTAAVSPERIERAIDIDLSSNDSAVRFRLSQGSIASMLLKQAIWIADSVDLNWYRWVVGFSRERQKDFLQLAGLEFLTGYKLALATVAAFIITILLVSISLRFKSIREQDPLIRLWKIFLKKLQAGDLRISASEGPLVISEKAGKAFPQQARLIETICRLYIQQRYSRSQKNNIRLIKSLIRQFRA